MTKKNSLTESLYTRRLALPTNPRTLQLQKCLSKCPMQIATTTSIPIREIVRRKPPSNMDPRKIGSVYKIPCYGGDQGSCDKIYISETSQEFDTRLKKHQRSLKIDDRSYAVVLDRESTHHRINLKKAKIICNQRDLTKRRIIEAAVIDRANTMKQRPGFYKISPYISDMILVENKIKI